MGSRPGTWGGGGGQVLELRNSLMSERDDEHVGREVSGSGWREEGRDGGSRSV